MKITVRKARHGAGNWIITQPSSLGAFRRVFVYQRFWQASWNADRLARYRPINTYGLRNFHIEQVSR